MDLVRDLKRHFRPELKAEEVNAFHPDLQGIKAFDTDERPILAAKYRECFPRTPIDWDHDKMNYRTKKGLGSYHQLNQKLARERSDEELPEAKAQRTLHR